MTQLTGASPMQPSFVLPANGIATPDSIARKRKMAEALLQQGMDSSPIASPWQGVSRIAQALFGGMAMNRADTAEAEGRKSSKDAMMRALSGDAGTAPSQSDPNGAMIEAMSNPWNDQYQNAMLLDKYKSNQPQQPDYRMFESGGDQYRFNQNDPNSKPELFFDAPDQQPDFRPATPEEKQQYGVAPETPLVITKAGPKILSDGKTSITNNVGGAPGDGKLRESLDKAEGDTWAEYKKAAAISGSNAQDFAVLDELIKVAPQGPLTGRLAQAIPGVSSAGAAFQSIVKRIAPTLRAPGSGATSDIEYEGMLASLPALANKPEANRVILEIMRQKSDLNIQRGEIITQYQTGAIDAQAARTQMAELDRVSIITPEMKQVLGGLGSSAQGSGADVPAPPGWEQEWEFLTPEERQEVLGQ